MRLDVIGKTIENIIRYKIRRARTGVDRRFLAQGTNLILASCIFYLIKSTVGAFAFADSSP